MIMKRSKITEFQLLFLVEHLKHVQNFKNYDQLKQVIGYG